MVRVQDLPEETLFMIAGRATPVKMAPGHEICSQGDPADCIWLLHEGALRDLPLCFCLVMLTFHRKAQQLAHMSFCGDVIGKMQQVYCSQDVIKCEITNSKAHCVAIAT